MERKQFLELCQMNSSCKNSVKVIYNDTEFYPISLTVWFDSNGKCHNSAVLKEVKSNSSLTTADIAKITLKKFGE